MGVGSARIRIDCRITLAHRLWSGAIEPYGVKEAGAAQPPRIDAVLCAVEARREAAAALAASLELPFHWCPQLPALARRARRRVLQEATQSGAAGLLLVSDAQGLAIEGVGPEFEGRVQARWHEGASHYRRQRGDSGRELIARAVGTGSGADAPAVLDPTAGLGGDGFVLATKGCEVTLVERNPIVFALLKDALARAKAEVGRDTGLQSILERIRIRAGDGREAFRRARAGRQPDVVYLDPMFPAGRRRAKPKKEMQALHWIVGADADAGGLLEPALHCARQRVVVKRPRLAPPLAGRDPEGQIVGKQNRFDIYCVQSRF